MAKLPINTNTLQYQLDHMTYPIKRRGKRLGMAQLGEECKRKLWYSFRWATVKTRLEGRAKHIFGLGDAIEEQIVMALKQLGIEVFDQQQGFAGFSGHAYGYIDGKLLGVPEAPKTIHLLEAKSMKDKFFKKLIRLGLQATYPKHVSQCQRYMAANKLDRCIYIAYNKDTSEIHVIRLRADKAKQQDALRVEMEVIFAEEPPEQRYDGPKNYGCTFCDHKDTCWNGVPMEKSCRSCIHIELEEAGEWSCQHPAVIGSDRMLSFEAQQIGCERWREIGS